MSPVDVKKIMRKIRIAYGHFLDGIWNKDDLVTARYKGMVDFGLELLDQDNKNDIVEELVELRCKRIEENRKKN